MIYLVNGSKYEYSYKELVSQYSKFCSLSDDDFKYNIKDAIHLACFICFVKEIPTHYCLSDQGIIHELVHLQLGINEISILEIRNKFMEQLKLAP